MTFWKPKTGKQLKPSRLNPWSISLDKPAKAFYGDSDGDRIMNMFDCQPHNKRKQGEEHEKTYKATIYKKSSPALRAVYPKVKKETIEKYKSKQPKGEVIEVEED